MKFTACIVASEDMYHSLHLAVLYPLSPHCTLLPTVQLNLFSCAAS